MIALPTEVQVDLLVEIQLEIFQVAGYSASMSACTKCWSLESKNVKGFQRERQALAKSEHGKRPLPWCHQGGYFRGVKALLFANRTGPDRPASSMCLIRADSAL